MLKRKLLVSAVLATLSSATLAAAPGFYVGGQLGWSKADYEQADDKTGLGGRLNAGYQFDQNWSAELGYTRYANSKIKNARYDHKSIGDVTLKNNAIDIVAKGTLPLDNGFNLFAKAGLAYIKVKADAAVAFEDENKWRPTYGIGAGYDFNQNVTADISWMRVQNGGVIPNLDVVSAGIGYHFG